MLRANFILREQHEHIVYDYQIDDGRAGSKSSCSQKSVNLHSKQSEFDRNIEVKKLLIDASEPVGVQQKTTAAPIESQSEKRQTIKVSAGEQARNADLP